MNATVEKYRKPDGYATRYWSVMVNGKLLAVTVYRKGAQAVASAINSLQAIPDGVTLGDPTQPYTVKAP